ncbi:MAG: hypothetical protein FWC79_05130 [Oscillospiraceae bacterium]|nr:hypothetical protein [Oscillospiraceae bacterium]
MNVKELAIKAINELPEEATIKEVVEAVQKVYDNLYAMELKVAVERGLDDIRKGRVMSLEEARACSLRELDEKYEY